MQLFTHNNNHPFIKTSNPPKIKHFYKYRKKKDSKKL